VKFKRIDQVVSWRLCSGCGACVPSCPEHAINLVDIVDQGIRPVVNSAKCRWCGECIKVCPGIALSHEPFNGQTISELRLSWGPILEVWEGYAADSEIRFKASSGGIATALSLFCLAETGMSSVLHTGTDTDNPLVNIPVLSHNREQLISRAGSRYSPAASCSKFDMLEKADSPCVFIGKPCDIAALRKSQAANTMLDSKVGLAISIFCAGTPSTNGTYKLLEALGVKSKNVEELRYRGYGWPGSTVVTIKGSNGQVRKMTYEESWGGILSNYGQLRCRLCPDGTGEFADISCGDPWHREIKQDEPGRSLILVRTERGRKILHSAADAGYIELERVTPEILPASQKSLLGRRRDLFGRLLMMRIMFIPVPYYKGFYLFRNWLELTAIRKLRSLGGTLKRIILCKWKKPLKSVSQATGPENQATNMYQINSKTGGF
jgi:coenzyme F420 hydrogenase subunit beta